ncbi:MULTISPECIES: hypothetical protein [unclassified Halanaerobium]|uniref:hypothetical protein n=1 Tax=unclassified Halanaerobium TaxID=2641197 RepID=UPI000DF3884A|nr:MULTISPECIES: hypothetical protein [unclassified Halanaerobium]RCW40120.1 hypothetical protein DFR78_1542 [Halanaerobium sp. MA284_MarDTE_T2]RCW80752.1 hypothetical protein DER71_12829 [Halanaerobium sp. DL-01]
MLKKVLSELAVKLNKKNIRWGVGASVMLNYYGLVDSPNDIDIIVSSDDSSKADKILRSTGEKNFSSDLEIYKSDFFANYSVNGVEVDLIAGFSIKQNSSYFKYDFDKNSITEMWNLESVEIPVAAIEDWYILYQLMPNREEKVMLIEDYFLQEGSCRVDLLQKNILKLKNDKASKRTKKLIDRLKS